MTHFYRKVKVLEVAEKRCAADAGCVAQMFQRRRQGQALAGRLDCGLQQRLGALVQRLGITQTAQQIRSAG